MSDEIQAKTNPFIDSELDKWLESLPRLLAYPVRLADARKRKASKTDWGINAEQGLLCEAREVERITRGLAASALRSLNQLNAAGQIALSYQSFVERFSSRKELPVSELCVELLNECKASKNAQLGEHEITAFIEMVSRLDDAISFERDLVYLTRKNVRVEITSARRTDGVLSNGARIRFQPDLLRVATDNLSSTGRMGAGCVRNPDVHQHYLSDAAAAGISCLLSTAEGHIRRLEEIGLQTYEGSEPGTIGAVIIVIGIAFISAGTGMLADGNNDGWWLIGGGILLITGGAIGGGAELLLETAKAAIAEAVAPLVA